MLQQPRKRESLEHRALAIARPHRQARFFGLSHLTRIVVLGALKRADTLEIAFETKSLRTICESEAHAEDELGPSVAALLKRRLADLRAATSTEDLVAGRPRILDESSHQYKAVDVGAGYRMVFCANHPRNPVNESGGIGWPRGSRIKIVRIEVDDA